MPNTKSSPVWTPEKIAAKTQQIFVDQLGVDEGEVTPDSSIIDDLGADSLDFVEVIMAFEEAFGFEIPDHEAEVLVRIRDVNDYLYKKTQKLANKS